MGAGGGVGEDRDRGEAAERPKGREGWQGRRGDGGREGRVLGEKGKWHWGRWLLLRRRTRRALGAGAGSRPGSPAGRGQTGQGVDARPFGRPVR